MEATAGKEKKGDVLVTVRRGITETNTIIVESKYDELFLKKIVATAEKTLKELEVQGLEVFIKDFGAWDFTLSARIKCAVERFKSVKK